MAKMRVLRLEADHAVIRVEGTSLKTGNYAPRTPVIQCLAEKIGVTPVKASARKGKRKEDRVLYFKLQF